MNKRLFVSVFILIFLFTLVARPQVVFADDGTNPPPETTETSEPQSTDPAETPVPETEPTSSDEGEATSIVETEAPTTTETTETEPVVTEATQADPTETDAIATDSTPNDPTASVLTEAPPTEDVLSTPEPNGTQLTETEIPSTESVSATPESIGTESPVSTEAPVATEAPEEETPEPVSVPEILEQAPEGTDLVVLDESGQTEPLASQEAADILASGDPMWCPGTSLPGSAGCSSSYNTFDDLLTDVTANPANYSGDGTIYVAYDYNTVNPEPYDVDVNGSIFSNPGSITIQGGWDFTTNALFVSNPYSAFNTVSLSISNWTSVNVNNITFNGSNYGLEISNTGDVSLTDVEVLNTLNNNGVTVNSTGNVDLTNVNVADSTGSDGIAVTTAGDVNLTNVTSTSNDYNGASITANNVDLKDSTFDGNGNFDNTGPTPKVNGNGLDIISGGNVNATNVTANDNYSGGANVEAQSGSVTLTNSQFNNNGYFDTLTNTLAGSGVDVVAGSSLTLEGVDANNNYTHGASFETGADLQISDSNFNQNNAYATTGVANGYGMDATANGSITLNNVIADDNYIFGASLTSNTSTLFIGNSSFSGNLTSSGLFATSADTMSLTQVTASSNGSYGASLEGVLGSSINIFVDASTASSNTSSGMTITGNNIEVQGSTFENNGSFDSVTSKVNGSGLEIYASGNTSISSTIANSNYDSGAYVEAPNGSVDLTNSQFNSNGYFDTLTNTLAGFGVDVIAGSTISLDGVDANSNYTHGASLEAGTDLQITDSNFNQNNAFSATGVSSGYGLDVTANGSVTLTNVMADTNYTFGASATSNTSTLDVSNSSFSGNVTSTGLYATSADTMTLTQVTASNNGSYGASLEGVPGSSINIFVNSSVASSNAFSGMTVTGNNIDVQGSTFEGNGSFDSVTPKINGYGFEVYADGNANIADTTANSNFNGGANVEALNGSVILTNSQFNGNGYYDTLTNTLAGFGLDAIAGTTMTLDGVDANNNYTHGAALQTGTSLQISNSNFSQNNAFTNTGVASGYGFDATAGEDITLANVVADTNYTFGASVTSNTGALDITDSSFSGNTTSAGLYAIAPGVVTLSQVAASNNGYYGASLESSSNVFVNNSVFTNNVNSTKYTVGLEVITPGIVSLTDVTASQNRDNGIDVYNSQHVELRNVTAMDNGWNGVYVEGKCSRVYVFGGTYSGNGFSRAGYGIDIASGKPYLYDPIFSNNNLGDVSFEKGNCFYVPPDEPIITSLPYGTVLPWANLDALNGKSYFLNCEQYSGTIISLENGDHVVLPCPISDKGSLSRVTQQNLPIILPSEYTYVSGMKVDISNNEIPSTIVDAGMVVSFTAADLGDKNLVILYWTGFEWKELPAFVDQNRVVYSSSSDTTYWDGTQWLQLLSVPTDKQFVVSPGLLTQEGFFEAAVNFTGIFILAEK